MPQLSNRLQQPSGQLRSDKLLLQPRIYGQTDIVHVSCTAAVSLKPFLFADTLCTWQGNIYSSVATCTQCDAGTYKALEGSSSCLACAKGKFSELLQSTYCKDCPVYSDTVSTGADTISDCLCNKGYTGNGGCRQCYSGTYKALEGSDDCKYCEAGKYISTEAATVCQSCPTYATSPVGSSLQVLCLCDSGYGYLVGQSRCSACPAGKFKSYAGNYECETCPQAKYSTAAASTQCQDCPSGSNAPVGSTSVVQCLCQPGLTGRIYSSTDKCIVCSNGKYKSNEGYGACTNCPAGMYGFQSGAISEDSCGSCPIDATSYW